MARTRKSLDLGGTDCFAEEGEPTGGDGERVTDAPEASDLRGGSKELVGAVLLRLRSTPALLLLKHRQASLRDLVGSWPTFERL